MVPAEALNDDALFVAQTLRGDRQAFRVLVERYQARLVRLATRILGRKSDGEDAAQETFIKAYRALARFDHGRSFSSWLFRICINDCIDRRRKTRHVPDADLEVMVEGEQARSVERTDTIRAIQAALLRLDEPYRVALVLKDVEELDYETMSEILDESVPALKIRVIRAREKLAKTLRKLHPDLLPPV